MSGAVVLVRVLSACGDEETDGDGDGDGAANCLADGTTTAISANHGHTMTVTSAEISAGVDKTYDISGTGGHAHSVTITAAMFAMLAANTSITMTSTPGSTDSHTHVVTIACA